MLESTAFTYNDTHSTEIGVINCKVDSGLFEEGFLPSRSIIEEKIPGRDKPYFKGFDYDPFEFPMTLYFEDGMCQEKRRNLAMLLMTNYYKPLIFESNPSRIFYCMYQGDPRLLHNGIEQGYVTITMRCDSPFSYTPFYTTDVYDLSKNNTSGSEIVIENYGHDICEPYIRIEKIGEGNISIVNYSDGGRECKLFNVLNGDVLNVDCENEQIETEVAGYFKYENHNNKFVRLVKGVNRLKIYGNCRLQFTYQFKLFQG